MKTLQERFDSKYEIVEPGGCWVWTAGVKSKNYGVIRDENGVMQLAHRMSWELHNGKIPYRDGYHGMCVLHRCDNPLCVNPDHLFLGSIADNAADMVSKNRSPNNKGMLNPNVKLTDGDIVTIRLLAKTTSNYKLAKLFRVGFTQIGRIVRGEQRRDADVCG